MAPDTGSASPKRIFTGCLPRGSPTDAIPEGEALIIHSIWGLLDHDLPHAGELSLWLGAGGMPEVEIWLVAKSHLRP